MSLGEQHSMKHSYNNTNLERFLVCFQNTYIYRKHDRHFNHYARTILFAQFYKQISMQMFSINEQHVYRFTDYIKKGQQDNSPVQLQVISSV